MKILLSLVVALIFMTEGKCQRQLGLDKNPVVTQDEAFLLDSIFQKKRGSFSFAGKKVGYFTGHSFESLATKDRFFKDFLLPRLSKNEAPLISYIQLDNNQKKESGGYDLIVMQVPKIIRKNQLKSNLAKLAATE